MEILTAPETVKAILNNEHYVKVFLGGGITNCQDWQSAVINTLKDYDRSHPNELSYLAVLNPRRENFPKPEDDSLETAVQIKWEFESLEKCDVFSMYFCAGESDQPICMYELGRHLSRMQSRFPKDWPNRIIISSSSEYKRYQDVECQTYLAKSDRVQVHNNASSIAHAFDIILAYNYVAQAKGLAVVEKAATYEEEMKLQTGKTETND